MSVHKTSDRDHQPSIGVDAVSFERYTAVQTDDKQLIVYDEQVEAAWVQSDDWIDALAMA